MTTTLFPLSENGKGPAGRAVYQLQTARYTWRLTWNCGDMLLERGRMLSSDGEGRKHMRWEQLRMTTDNPHIQQIFSDVGRWRKVG